MSLKRNVQFIISVSVDDSEAPEFMKKYFV